MAYAAASTGSGRVPLLDQVISGILTAVGGGIVGAVISILVTGAASREVLEHVTTILENSLSSTLRSEDRRLAFVRHLWHHYYVTEIHGRHVWRYEKYPFHLSAQIGSLDVLIDILDDEGEFSHTYRVEAFIRHEHLVILSEKIERGGDGVFVEVFPQFTSSSKCFGIGFVDTWDATNVVTKTVLSRNPLVSGIEGTLMENESARMDEIWEAGFKRTNDILPDCP